MLQDCQGRSLLNQDCRGLGLSRTYRVNVRDTITFVAVNGADADAECEVELAEYETCKLLWALLRGGERSEIGRARKMSNANLNLQGQQ